jgi:predicted ribosomally synthesized peptide with SipW-like signal peptide
MKKIFASLLTIVAVAAIASGATRAYFTSQVTQENLTFATGTLEINDTSEAWMNNITFNNLKPGDSIQTSNTMRKWVVIKNTGSLDIGSLKVSAVNKEGDTALLDHITISTNGRVGNNTTAVFTNNWAPVKPTVNSWMTNADVLDVAFYGTPAGVIHPGESYTVTLDFAVPAELGNEWQGKNVTFDLVFEAEQIH